METKEKAKTHYSSKLTSPREEFQNESTKIKIKQNIRMTVNSDTK
jgi:hypothetical protein